jgi:ABC-type thiamine transport system ATPase subunit
LKQGNRYGFLPSAVQRALERASIRQRAALLTEERFQALSQAIGNIEAISLRLLNDESQSALILGYQNELQEIYRNAQTATHVVQELFHYRFPDSTNPGSI